MRGRGGNPRGRGKGMRAPFVARSFPRPVYDEFFFGPGDNAEQMKEDEAWIAEEIRKADAVLKPTLDEEAVIRNLVTKVTSAADNLIVAPGSFSGCQLEEVRGVGSFKKNTMTRLNLTPDIVIVLKTLPLKDAIDQLSTKIVEDLRTQGGIFGCYAECTPKGFTVHTDQGKVNCLVATIPQNIRSLDKDIHLDAKIIHANISAIKHSRWFEENGHHPSVRVLARILRGIAARFAGFAPLKTWMIDFLAHHSIMVTDSTFTLSPAQGLSRALSLLAAGLFLPLSSSIVDPVEDRMLVKIHAGLSLEDQDLVCMTAQTLVRILRFGGLKIVVGTEGRIINLDKALVVNGVTIRPQERVYERPAVPTEATEEMENEEVNPAMMAE